MKRDMDLARKIMLAVEEAPYQGGWIEVKVEGYSADDIAYHVMLLDEAGLIEAQNLSHYTSLSWKPIRLTWAGYEFIEASRDDKRWKQAKEVMISKAGGLVFDVLKTLLIQLATRAALGG